MIWALLVATMGIAATDVVVDALMVEQGLRLGRVKQFQGQQWLWLNVAAIMAALLGGWLSHSLDPAEAVHTAAMIVIGVPAAVMLAALFLVKEDKVALDPVRMRRTAWTIGTALKSRTLWTVAGFLAFWNLIPNFSTPLYYHLTDHLRFDQYFIGQLVSIGSIGAVLGALTYRRCLADRLSTQHLVALSIALNTILALGYLWLNGSTAVVLYFFGGVVSMIALLTLFSLAASVCPPQAAGFTFASLMAIHSVTTHLSAMIGGHLYERIFDHQLGPLIILAAVVTLAAFFWIPFLPVESNARGKFEAGREYVTS
jgi:Na+/melibiose symporter-like transporter